MMTKIQIIKYYADLLIMQYKGKPKALAHAKLLVEPAIFDFLPDKIMNAFDIETAIGKQLDVVGKYIGVARTNPGFQYPITLDDDDYRQLIKMKILSNNSGSSLKEIQDLLQIYFKGQVVIFDNRAMNLSYYMDSAAGTLDFAQVVVTIGILPRPMGVGISSVIYYSDVTKFFGMCSYQLPARNVSPFNDYEDYQMGTPWLDYEYAIAY